MFKKILVAFDGSPHSEEALRKAVERAQAGEEVHLTILSVAPPPSTFIASGPAYTAVSVRDFQEEIDRSWGSQLDQALATVPDDVRSRVDTKLTHGPGSPGPSIAEEAGAGDYDLLIAGSRGNTALKSFFIGSVSLHLVHASPIPVLVVHLKDDSDS